LSCFIAAAWKVRACTPPTPSARRRVRISPAARAVKVTGEQGGGRHRAGQDGVRRPVGDRARLARAGAREDDHRPAHRPRRRLLLGVEGGEDVVGGQRCGHPDSLPVAADGKAQGARLLTPTSRPQADPDEGATSWR
jgi:hypothetical protein